MHGVMHHESCRCVLPDLHFGASAVFERSVVLSLGQPLLTPVVHAGRWHSVPQSDWPTGQAQRDIILQDFDPADSAIGDRRQV